MVRSEGPRTNMQGFNSQLCPHQLCDLDKLHKLCQEDALEREMETHSSILAWRIPWTEEPGGATVCGVAKSQTSLSD